jgi:hypothetical protein
VTTRLSLVIPLFNEERRLGSLQTTLIEFLETPARLAYEIVFVDDGSRDTTAEGLASVRETLLDLELDSLVGVEIVQFEENRGKGAALRAGVDASTGDWILTLDCDMATDPRQLLEWLAAGHVDLSGTKEESTVYIGCREHPDSRVRDRPLRRVAGRVFNLLQQIVTGVYQRDTQCGFKLYPAALARRCFHNLRSRGWAHDIEVLMLAEQFGARIVDLPVVWTAEGDSKIHVARDGVRMFLSLPGIRLSLIGRRLFGRLAEDPARVGAPEFPWSRITLWVVVLLVALVLGTFATYGITWDEYVQHRYGEAVLDYLGSLFEGPTDTEALGYLNLYYYGGLFDTLAVLAGRVSPFGPFETRHLLNGLFGLLAILAAMRLGGHLGGDQAAFWAVVLLALTPRFYGHMFNNPKDIPFAAGYALAVYYLVRALPYLPTLPRGLALKTGLVTGIAMGVRVGGLLLLVYLAALLAVAVLVEAGRDVRRAGRKLLGAVTSFAWVALPAYGLMLAFWPWAQQAPLTRPFIALQEFSKFDWTSPVLFRGIRTPAPELADSYLLHYLGITLPEIVLGLLLAGAILGLWCIVERPQRGIDPKALGVGVVIVSALYPLVHIAMTEAIVYDGMRQVLFVVPSLATLAALVLAAATRWVADRSGVVRLVAASILAGLLVWQIGQMVRLHPYQTVYFNRLVGGLPGAHGRYETDYWASSFREAVLELADRVPERAAIDPYGVRVCGPTFPAAYFLPEDFVLVTSQPDFLLTILRGDCADDLGIEALFAVERFGVPLSRVYDLRGVSRDPLLSWPPGD